MSNLDLGVKRKRVRSVKTEDSSRNGVNKFLNLKKQMKKILFMFKFGMLT